MEELVSFLIGVFVTIAIGSIFFTETTTYPMMVKAEKVCYSNQGIKHVKTNGSRMTAVCNNGATFKFEEEDYRNE